MIKVKYSDIIYIESMKDYIKIVRLNEKPLLVKQAISSLEEALPANLFLRIHRSFIICLDKIVAYNNHDIEIGGYRNTYRKAVCKRAVEGAEEVRNGELYCNLC